METTNHPLRCPCGGLTVLNQGPSMQFASCARSGFGIWDPVNGFQDRCPYSCGTAKESSAAYLYAANGAPDAR